MFDRGFGGWRVPNLEPRVMPVGGMVVERRWLRRDMPNQMILTIGDDQHHSRRNSTRMAWLHPSFEKIRKSYDWVCSESMRRRESGWV